MGINPRNLKWIKQPPAYTNYIFIASFLAMTVFAWRLDFLEEDRCTKFRDKSALFGGTKGPNDEPSWGRKNYNYRFTQLYQRERDGH